MASCNRSAEGSVCIIGGGVAGIATARVLLADGFTCTLFEKTEELGGVWADNYTGSGIQVPSRLYEFPDDPLPRGWDYASASCITSYILKYARKHGVTSVAWLGCSVE